MMALQHQPVMFHEVLDRLDVQPSGIYIDSTFGRGGHSQAILERLDNKGRLIAIDRDPEAIAYAQKIVGHDPRVCIYHSRFSQLAQLAETIGILGSVNGILFDLGVSSPHLDDPKRGFSFKQSGPLDMRMDNTEGPTAAAWLKQVDETALADVLFQYGEERRARRIARAIVSEREQGTEITTTQQLATLIARAIPGRYPHKHPATRSFQAIRIFINQEMDELDQALSQALEVLAVGGRLAVMSFHSLEDRRVKKFFMKQAQGEPIPRGLPAPPDFCARVSRINGAIKPSEQEIRQNPRARSATLRVVEKLL